MTNNLRDVSATGEGTLVRNGAANAPLPEKVSPSDMQLLLAFKDDLQAAERAYNSLLSQYSMRYQLRPGDHIGIDGVITRQEQGRDADSS